MGGCEDCEGMVESGRGLSEGGRGRGCGERGVAGEWEGLQKGSRWGYGSMVLVNSCNQIMNVEKERMVVGRVHYR